MKVLVSLSPDGRLLQALGPAHENERSPNFRHVRCCGDLRKKFNQYATKNVFQTVLKV